MLYMVAINRFQMPVLNVNVELLLACRLQPSELLAALVCDPYQRSMKTSTQPYC